LFIGLGVKVVYPADFSGSPYSILACGITMPPQRLAFPFSVVKAPSARWEGIPSAYNEIAPAWLLTDNLYALKRNEAKYRARNTARRMSLQCDVFRPETVDRMRDACRRLEAAPKIRDVYTERDIEGLGKNYLTETNRQRALGAYRFHIHYYALLGMLEQAEATLDCATPSDVTRLLMTPSNLPCWEHQRQILSSDPNTQEVVPLLRELESMLHVVARDVERSRMKDDLRGQQIISDYEDVHVPADKDPLVQETWKGTRLLQERLRNVLLRMDASSTRHSGQTGQATASYAIATT
jgi:hypothetical protein